MSGLCEGVIGTIESEVSVMKLTAWLNRLLLTHQTLWQVQQLHFLILSILLPVQENWFYIVCIICIH